MLEKFDPQNFESVINWYHKTPFATKTSVWSSERLKKQNFQLVLWSGPN